VSRADRGGAEQALMAGVTGEGVAEHRTAENGGYAQEAEFAKVCSFPDSGYLYSARRKPGEIHCGR